MMAVTTMTAPPSNPLRAAAGLPETVAPMAMRRIQTMLEINPEIRSVQPAGAGSSAACRNRLKVKTLPAPGPIRGMETEIAFPARAVAAMAGIEAWTPAARRTIRWVRANAIIDTSSNAAAASSHPHCARPRILIE